MSKPEREKEIVQHHYGVMNNNAPFVRSPYNYDRNAASDESGLECKDPSLAVQSAKDETDINVIVKRFGVTGHLPQTLQLPTYGDFDQVDDYRTALEMVRRAEYAFGQLPAEMRVRFNNDPQEFLAFVDNPANAKEMLDLGLAIARPNTETPGKGGEGPTGQEKA